MLRADCKFKCSCVEEESGHTGERLGRRQVETLPVTIGNRPRQGICIVLSCISHSISNVPRFLDVGEVDVVFCAGVLYHHPSPFDVLVALRHMCRHKLTLRTYTIPEISGLPNAAVYFPLLESRDRLLWELSTLGVSRMVGIANEFQPEEGYGNVLWGVTPSCLVSMLRTAGSRIDLRATEVFAQIIICSPIDVPLVHRLPTESEAQEMAEVISKAGIARPC
jgi:hypothetical protein